MEMQMDFLRKIPEPEVLRARFPVDEGVLAIKAARDQVLSDIFTGREERFLLVIGPCSADREDAVLEYMYRLARLREKTQDKLFLVPRVYTNKPRTRGVGYKGMLHQPDPKEKENLFAGVIAIREMHARIARETGFTCAEEMLYPENHRYLSDLLCYVAVGARSVENQGHRNVASGIGIPAGMKNPTAGDLSVMMNSIAAAQSPQEFIYAGWEVATPGNPMAHAILRGYVDNFGRSHPNYHYEDLQAVCALYGRYELANPAVVVDTNHNNSGKQYLEQIRIAKDVMHSRRAHGDIRKLVKGLMIESYLEDGCQKVGGNRFGCSITDPCLGWEKTERLVLDLAELL